MTKAHPADRSAPGSGDVSVAPAADVAAALETEQGGWTTRWVAILAAIVLLTEIASFMPQAIGASLTPIAEHFHTTDLGWVSTLGLLFGGLLAPLIGKAADVHGKKKVLLACIVVTGIGGIVSALAPSYALFLVGRSLSSFVAPVTFLGYSLIRDCFPRRLLILAISLTGTGIGITTIGTPLLTGWLIDAFGYRGLYWFFGLYPLVTGLIFLLVVPESPRRNRVRLGVLGAVFLGAGIGAILLGVSEGSTWGWTSGRVLALLIGGVALGVLWVVYDLRSDAPLVDVRLFASRPILTVSAAAALVYTAMTANALMLPIMVMVPRVLGRDYGFGVSTFGVAAYLVPLGVAMVVVGYISGRVGPRVGIRSVFILGTLFIAAGCLLTALDHGTSAHLIGWDVLIGIGIGMCLSTAPNLLVAATPPEQQASTATMAGVPQTLLTSIGGQVFFVILAHHVGTVVQGNVIFANSGFVVVFVIGAILSLAAGVVGLLIPHGHRPQHMVRATDSAAADSSAFAGSQALPTSTV